ncbi:hypothetical protein F4802DRAFT_603260 [Xylaria palmicola]|nr:hypothetical protein F4802DRAFT_603260 [Xylaria palmicola]
MFYHVVARWALKPRTPSVTSIVLRVFTGLLILDSLIELSFISSTISWLDDTARHKIFRFVAYGSKHHLSGLPRHLIVDHADLGNGAAATALVVVGFGGIISILLRNWAQYRKGELAKLCRYFYYLWLAFNIPALIFTSAALIYVFAVTNARAGQRIDTPLAVNLNGRTYDRGIWTPVDWFSAVLRLRLTRDREEILKHLTIMRGWQYNLITMFLLQLGETFFALMDYKLWTRKPRLPEAYSGF